MFGFLLNLFNSDLDNNCENNRDEELTEVPLKIGKKTMTGNMIIKMKIFGIIS